jgi:uncharacterized phage infection (PIP) family protein YhgE
MLLGKMFESRWIAIREFISELLLIITIGIIYMMLNTNFNGDL